MNDRELFEAVLNTMGLYQLNAFKHHLASEGKLGNRRMASLNTSELAHWVRNRGARIAYTKAKRNNLGRGETPTQAYARVYASRLAKQLAFLKQLLAMPTDG